MLVGARSMLRVKHWRPTSGLDERIVGEDIEGFFNFNTPFLLWDARKMEAL